MSKTEFIILCNKYLISPNIALENKNIQDALLKRNDIKVIKILKTEY